MKKCRDVGGDSAAIDVNNEPSRGQRLFQATLEARAESGPEESNYSCKNIQHLIGSMRVTCKVAAATAVAAAPTETASRVSRTISKTAALKIHKISTLDGQSEPDLGLEQGLEAESEPEPEPAWPVWLIQFKVVSEAANLLAIDPTAKTREQLIFYRFCRCSCTCNLQPLLDSAPLCDCCPLSESVNFAAVRVAKKALLRFISFATRSHHPLYNFNYRLLVVS